MDLPGLVKSALGLTYRFEHLLGRGRMIPAWLSHDLRHSWPA